MCVYWSCVAERRCTRGKNKTQTPISNKPKMTAQHVLFVVYSVEMTET